MEEVSVRELRNQVSAVLRRVEAGERVRITVDRRPVAELSPLDDRPSWVSGDALRALLDEERADPGLSDDLAEALQQTTDGL